MGNIVLDEKKKIITVNDLKQVKPKKISGTNLGVILGYNSFQTPFQAWCDMMKVYKKPFRESKELTAGKEIENLQIKYIKEKYNLSGLITPTDKFGPDFFNKTHGNFFPMDDHFQGMWDALNTELQTGEVKSVIEMKTTKKKNQEKWKDQIPFYYVLQCALYAYLSNTKRMTIVASFLEDKDYDKPLGFVPNENNTIIVPYTLDKDIPKFEEFYIKPAIMWWDKHIVQGISPEYNEFIEGDVEIVKEIKKQLEEEKKKSLTVDINDILKEQPFY